MGRSNWAAKIIMLSCAFVFAILIFLNTHTMITSYNSQFFIPALISFLVIYFFVIKIPFKPKTFIIILFVASFTFKAAVAAYLKTEPISDFSLFWKAARQIAEGKREYLHWGYFDVWAYQTGITMYYAVIVKLFGANPLVLQYFNCMWMALTNLLIYAFAKKMSGESAARIASLLYLIYPEPYFICSTLSNQMLGDCVVFAAAYLFIRKNSNINMILAGILGALANAARPSGIIFILAVICILGSRSFNYKGSLSQRIPAFLQSARDVITVVIPYLLMGIVISSFVKYSGINPDGLKNNFPLYKFVVGLNLETHGEYSEEDAKLTGIEVKEQRNSAALSLIHARLKSAPSQLVNHFYIKLNNMWADFDTLSWSFEGIKSSNIGFGRINITYDFFKKCILGYEKAFYIIIIFMAMLGCLICLKKKEAPIPYLMPSTMFFLYFMMQILIEIQLRYRYFALIAIFILVGKAFETIIPPDRRENLK